VFVRSRNWNFIHSLECHSSKSSNVCALHLYTVLKGKPLIFYNLLPTCFGHRSLGIAP